MTGASDLRRVLSPIFLRPSSGRHTRVRGTALRGGQRKIGATRRKPTTDRFGALAVPTCGTSWIFFSFARIIAGQARGPKRWCHASVGLDEQLTTYQLQTFLHAGQAKSHASTRRIDVEADAFIANGEMDGVAGSAKMHIELLDLAVSHRVVQGFLEDPEETERRVGGTFAGTFSERKSISTFFCPETSRQKPRMAATIPRQQPWRVQLVRQRLHIGDDLRGLLLKRIQAAEGLARGI